MDSEHSRRIGAATSDFRRLKQLWSHVNVPRDEKLKFFASLIVSKLTYGLATAWLVTAQRRRLDGFYARCLRRILRIPPAFISRVSNKIVFDRAGVAPLSWQLFKRQLSLLGRAARSPSGSLMRQCAFRDNSVLPQIGRFIRRVGRPRQDWTTQLLKEGAQLFGPDLFTRMLSDTSEGADVRWKQTLQRLFSSG